MIWSCGVHYAMGGSSFGDPDDSDMSSQCSDDGQILPEEREEVEAYVIKVHTNGSVRSKKSGIGRAISVERSVSRVVSSAGTDAVSAVGTEKSVRFAGVDSGDMVSIMPSSAAGSIDDAIGKVPTERESCVGDKPDDVYISRAPSGMSGAPSYMLPVSAAPSAGGMSAGKSVASGPSVSDNRSVGFVVPVIEHCVQGESPEAPDIVIPIKKNDPHNTDNTDDESPVTVRISHKPKSRSQFSCCRRRRKGISSFESRDEHVLLKMKKATSQHSPRNSQKMGIITGATLDEMFDMMSPKMQKAYIPRRNYLRQIKVDDDQNMYIEDHGKQKFIVYHELGRIYSTVQLYDFNIQKIPSSAVVQNASANIAPYLQNYDLSIFYDTRTQEIICFGLDDKIMLRTYDHVLKLRGGVPYINLMDMCT